MIIIKVIIIIIIIVIEKVKKSLPSLVLLIFCQDCWLQMTLLESLPSPYKPNAWTNNWYLVFFVSNLYDGHCLKSVRIWSYSGPCFLKTERYFVFPGIQFKCAKIRTRMTPSTDHCVKSVCIRSYSSYTGKMQKH